MGLKASAAVFVCLRSCKGGLAVVLLPKVSQLTGCKCLQASEQSIREQEEIQKEATLGVGPVTTYPPGWIHRFFFVCVPVSMSSMPTSCAFPSNASHSLVAYCARERTAQGIKFVEAPISDARWL